MRFFALYTTFGLLYSFTLAEEWGYTKLNGPAKWGQINKKYSACSSGKRQSPIPLDSTSYFSKSSSPTNPWINLSSPLKFLNNGHAITVNLDGVKAPKAALDCKSLTMKQFHMHTPSEHTINGKKSDLEAHFVFTDNKNTIFQVFGVMFELDSDLNDEGFFKGLSVKSSLNDKDSSVSISEINLGDLFDSVNQFRTGYVYRGSLTTPPCTEAVRFIISDKVQPISESQLNVFKKAFKVNNARPLQKITPYHKLGQIKALHCDPISKLSRRAKGYLLSLQ